jgi:hypothetical protein
MKGIHHIIVSNSFMKYEFDLKRNITILKGDSATGKTTLVEMIQEYLINGSDSGVNFSCDAECRVLTGNLWKEQIPKGKEAILFVDEGNSFIKSKEFAETVKNTGFYYVIVTRESLETLPISVDEIYGIKSSGKYGGLEPVYHEFYKVYEVGKKEKYPVTPRTLLVEDSNAGYEFFESVAKEKGLQCFSANGKSNIYNWLCDNTIESELLIIADGAAFGSQMNRIEILINKDSRIHLYLPESFEWLLLSANLFRKTYIDDVLENTADYIDYSDYFSWEQFFTATIMDVSKDTYLSYSKKKLNPNYLQGNIKGKILETIKNVFF